MSPQLRDRASSLFLGAVCLLSAFMVWVTTCNAMTCDLGIPVSQLPETD